MQLTAHSAARASVRGSLAFVTVAALALGLAACSGSDDPVPTPTVTVDPNTDADKNAAPEPVVPIVWPLTGVAVEEVPARPAIAVKVENTAAARPQSGLEDADIVWETIVEYEVSRFIAVFNSNLPKEVGPVRSARPVDLRVVTPANPLFVFSGAQKKMVQRIAKSDVQAISHDAGAAGLSRSSARRAPHNVYANLETIIKAADAEHSAAPGQQFTYAADAATASFDVVVACLVLCSVGEQDRALGEIARVLRPGGSLVFLEHVRSQSPGKAKFQVAFDRSRVWPTMAGGCHCSCQTIEGMERAGFEIVSKRDVDIGPGWSHTNPHVTGRAALVNG